MIVFAKVFPSSANNKIIKRKTRLDIFVKAPAQGGKANEMVIKILAEYFKNNSNKVKILSGRRSIYKKILV